jgi:hypothetical protein
VVKPSAFIVGWPNRAKCFEARLISSLSPLVLACAGDMLNQVTLELRCAPVVLGHWLVNKRGPEAV